MHFDAETLYNLLPAIYRIRDAEEGGPLRALLSVISEQVGVLEEDLAQLSDDQFIETCAEWVLPYIGDLLGVRAPHLLENTGAYNLRAYVANTLAYRRRKGTAAVLEQLARDLTGWPAKAVEFFQILATTQHLNHVRLNNVHTPDLRKTDQLELLGTPFDQAAYTAEVRNISTGRGRYNLPNVGLFLWRLRPYFLVRSEARAVGDPTDGRYTLSPLGISVPLFNRPQTETEISHLAEEINLPGVLRSRLLYDDLEAYRQALINDPGSAQSNYFGERPAFQVFVDGRSEPLLPEEMVVCSLDKWTVSGWKAPATETYTRANGTPFQTRVAIDPAKGRLATLSGLAADSVPQGVEVSHAYAFSADMGGGPYDRGPGLTEPSQAGLRLTVSKETPTDTIQKALQQWADQGKPPCIIQIADSRRYGEDFDIALPPRGWLAIEAANGTRPCIHLVGTTSITAPTQGAALTIHGLLVEGGFELYGALDLAVAHCTLVPGWALQEDGSPAYPDRDSLVAGGDCNDLTVSISHSIIGPIRAPVGCKHLTVHDSIVHAPAAAGARRPAIAADDTGLNAGLPATLERVTIWGSVNVRELTLASEVIFTAPIRCERRQVGCVRFSYVPDGSLTPRRHHCQPDLALSRPAQGKGLVSADSFSEVEEKLVRSRLRPVFTSTRYGDPGYAQLSMTCADEIRTDAEDGSEMGVFNSLKQPQREANLRAALDEYLRIGLEAGIFYVSLEENDHER